MSDKKETQIIKEWVVDGEKKRTGGNPVWKEKTQKIPSGPPAESNVPTLDELPPAGTEENLLSEQPQQELSNLPKKEFHPPFSKPDVVLPPGEESDQMKQKELPGFNKKR